MIISYHNGSSHLPQDVYAAQLKTIQGKDFTRREIDILACILSGKTAKKIALFLSISPKTVENHIRNIMLKLDCCSQASIIDFIEHSNKFLLVQKHYSHLLIHCAFESELKKIARLPLKKALTCVLICHPEHKEELAFFQQFILHLKLAGINVLTEQTKDKSNARANQTTIEPSLTVLFNHPSVDSTEKNNYYHFVFEALKKLLTTIHLDENIVCFQNQYATLFEAHDVGAVLTNNKLPSLLLNHWQGKVYNMIVKLTQKKNRWVFTVGVLCFIILSTAFCKTRMDVVTPTVAKEASALAANQNTDALNETTTKQAIEWNLPRQDHVFIGRQELLEALDSQFNTAVKVRQTKVGAQEQKTALQDPSNNHTTVITACRGLGGVGKTQLAIRYVRHTTHPYTLKAWFYAENVADLKQQYVAFAKTLGYKGENPEFSAVLPYIKGWLSKHPGWLLVYDNVSSYQEVKDFLPESGGNVVLTSRQRNWPNTFKMLDVDVMTEEEAVQLVQSITHQNVGTEHKEEVHALIKKLGYLPLAIAQASAYIKNNGITFSKYLALYDTAEQKMLADKTMPEGTAHIPVSVTWNTSLDAIKTEALQENKRPLSGILLTVCSYLNPDSIPKSFLLDWLKTAYPELEDPKMVLDQSLGQLHLYSLITLDARHDTISVHRVVQAALRHHHQHIPLNTLDKYYPALTQSWYDQILQVAHEEFTHKGPTPKDELARKQVLLPHLESIIARYNSARMKSHDLNLARVLFDAGQTLTSMQPLLAKTYLDQSLSILKKKYGSKHVSIEISRAVRNIGRVYWALGDLHQAKIYFEKSLKMDEQLPDSEITSTLNNLANVHGALGRLQEQYTLLEKCLKVDEQSPDHLSVAVPLHNLGNTYVALGKVHEGKMMIERSLHMREKAFGPNYVRLGGLLTSLGHAYWVLGDTKQAKIHLERALKIKEAYYDAEHVAMGITFNNVGNVYRSLGDMNQAKLYLENALKICEQHYGKHHLAIAVISNNLGEVYQTLGDPNQAKRLFERSQKIKAAYQVSGIPLNFGTEYGVLGDVNHHKTFKEKTEKTVEG